jgi:hypothetical protein
MSYGGSAFTSGLIVALAAADAISKVSCMLDD